MIIALRTGTELSRKLLLVASMAAPLAVIACGSSHGGSNDQQGPPSADDDALAMVAEGRETFRHDTFGDEDFWGGKLRLHEALATVTPRTALAVGLKVDSESLAGDVLSRIRRGQLDLDDPANTAELLREDAVVGVKGFFDSGGSLTSVGITCALCHSTVDDSIASGIGVRRDGWANRDLDVGTVIALAPDLSPFADLLGVSQDDVRTVLHSWGPGKFDAELLLDGKATRPDGKPAATLIPPAFGLAGSNLHTWTGWGSVPYWNAFVANLEMQGKGTFFDPRLDDAARFPIAASAGFGHKHDDDDRISGALPALHVYQLALTSPAPPAGSFDSDRAERGDALFDGKAQCARCHVVDGPEPGWSIHTGAEIGIDEFQAQRSPAQGYRTSPLRGLWTHTKGGFFHDGRFPTLRAVVQHYNKFFQLGLDDQEIGDLVEYLKSL
jgi:Cytochrome c